MNNRVLKENRKEIIKNKIKIALANVTMFFFRFIYKREKQIIFESFNGVQYSDNPRAISEKMHELYPEYKIVWHIRYPEKVRGFLPEYVTCVSSRKQFLRELSRSFCFVKNTEFTKENVKLPNQIYVQTWHGDRGFKKVLYDSGKQYSIGVEDGKVVDCFLTGSEYGKRVSNSAFHYNGYILNEGSPRNDRLIALRNTDKEQIMKYYGLSISTKILLFAPTFRDQNTKHQHILVDLSRVLYFLNAEGEKWICFVRSHVAAHIDFEENDFLMDVSCYPDMSDLLCAADMLITDYSTCACDYILTGKPTILATFDEEDYVNRSREFYVRPDESGFIVAHNQSELEAIIKNRNKIDFLRCREKTNQVYGVRETGHASESICHYINNGFKNRSKNYNEPIN